MNSTQSNREPVRASANLRGLGWFAFVILLVAGAIYLWSQSDSAPNLAWMGWTMPTAIFFITIVCLLLGMCIWEAFSPGGGPRIGILRFETTRGDRLFLSLLGSAFIHLAWLGLVGPDLWKALGVSVVYALLVFTLV
jgi:predicted small integral membrane protein